MTNRYWKGGKEHDEWKDIETSFQIYVFVIEVLIYEVDILC